MSTIAAERLIGAVLIVVALAMIAYAVGIEWLDDREIRREIGRPDGE